MKKKSMIGILIITFALLIIVIALLIHFNENVKVTKNLTDEILEKIDNQEDLLIYLTDKHENCYLCTDCNYIIDFYSESFGLNFINFNKSKNSEESYLKLIEELGYKDVKIVTPAVVMIKSGEVKGTANEIVSEEILKQFLIKFGFIDEQNQNRDYQLNEEDFNKKMNSEDKNVFVIYTYEGSHYDFRKIVLKLSNKYNFNYGLIYSGLAKNSQSLVTISESLGDKYTLPLVIITQNGEIIDYINSLEEKQLVSFLKKNEIID